MTDIIDLGNDGDPLPTGQVVSYGDMANPRQKAAVVAPPGDFGQPVIFLEIHHRSTVTRLIINGAGGWHLHEDEVLDADALDELRAAADAAEAAREAERRRDADARQRRSTP